VALIKCSECGKEISDKASACPHCGYPMGEIKVTEVERPAQEAPSVQVEAHPPTAEPPHKKSSIMIFVAFLVILTAVALAFASFDDRTKTARQNNEGKTKTIPTNATRVETVSKPEPYIPYEFAKDFVRDRLVAPSTAKFMPISRVHYVLYPDQKTWRITSFVDSQNAFGAMVRTKWSVKLIETKDTWKLLDIKFEQ